MKTCPKCGKTKEKIAFGKRAMSHDGLSGNCKECVNYACQEYRRLRTPEKILLESQEKEAAQELLNQGFKICYRCNEIKPVFEFSKCANSQSGLFSWCRSCQKINDAENYLLNREEELARIKARQLLYPREGLDAKRKRLFGVAPEDFDQIVLNQGGKCAICQEIFSDTPHLDHDHSSGKIRGVLCRRCNPGLGLFKDSPEKLRAAAEYLERK